MHERDVHPVFSDERLGSLSPTQAAALCEAVEGFADGPETRALLARMLGDPSLGPTSAEWAATRERRARAKAFLEGR